jgi:exopolyphosphatase / guanosine-5'-triphosphate,3'-diphosphate pyrophosphatase
MTNLITKTDAPKLLAAIDVGTNSFHLVIARVHHDGRIEVMTREKELVRLGHGGGDMTALEPEAIARGVAALTRMRMLAEAAGAPVRAVATSAVREAKNASVFLRAAHDTAGVEVEVITGIEEARLIHLGVLQSLVPCCCVTSVAVPPNCCAAIGARCRAPAVSRSAPFA